LLTGGHFNMIAIRMHLREPIHPPSDSMTDQEDDIQLATFGNGCFWCTEAVFQMLHGVVKVMPGYSGGQTTNPTYRDVCTGTTGHAEVIQITFQPNTIAFAELLEVFWKSHDPTTLNRQGADAGTQYRSVVFYHDEQQKAEASEMKQQLDKSGIFGAPIVTEITEFTDFYPAEVEHHNYYKLNPGQGYCRVVIRPKVEKVNEIFASKLKK
jgi:methionine-S-sulfoxide reductase